MHQCRSGKLLWLYVACKLVVEVVATFGEPTARFVFRGLNIKLCTTVTGTVIPATATSESVKVAMPASIVRSLKHICQCVRTAPECTTSCLDASHHFQFSRYRCIITVTDIVVSSSNLICSKWHCRD